MESTLSNRERQIIIALADSVRPVTSSYIGQILKVSSRTIRNEIKSINNAIELEIICSDKRGFYLNPAYKKFVQSLIQAEPQPDKKMQILKMLLFSKPNISFTDLADQNFISESSLQLIISEINKYLLDYNLQIVRKNAVVTLAGSEQEKRILINALITKEIDPIFLNIDNCSAYFPNIDIDKVKSAVEEALNSFNYYIDNFYLTNFYINLLIILTRSEMSDETDLRKYSNTVEYAIADMILKNYYKNNSYKESEAIDVARLLIGQVKPSKGIAINNSESEPLSNDFLDIIRSLLSNTFQHYMLDINSEEFLKVFAIHVDNMIKRCKENHQVINTDNLSGSIKYTCPFIYDVATYLANRIEDAFKVHIPDEEISLIAIHIGFSIEKSFKTSDKIRVYIICADYNQIVINLINELKLNYENNIEIAGVVTSVKKDSALLDSNDLIISMIPFNAVQDNICFISPFFTSADKAKLTGKIEKYLNKQRNSEFLTAAKQYFDKSLFFISDQYTTKDEVLKFLTNTVIKKKIVNKDYYKSVLIRESQSSTCFFGKFAIPHALTLDAERSSFCILINKNGIHWDNSSIPLVFLITINKADRKNFKLVYDGLIRSLLNQDTYQKLIHAQNYEEFISCFKTSKN